MRLYLPDNHPSILGVNNPVNLLKSNFYLFIFHLFIFLCVHSVSSRFFKLLFKVLSMSAMAYI